MTEEEEKAFRHLNVLMKNENNPFAHDAVEVNETDEAESKEGKPVWKDPQRTFFFIVMSLI